ncbi:sensor histidine kinase [Fimbriimonas ginsengisoli]|uniref:histidine kinase n=1 Tax=Fimbriimonas ginsengisoli Gsoil 348 TaxID=661478 RepID=A0A068NRT1_FIMGI|nr:ATP-binding protein [Fimbriimonas ginsengisoli]AIE86258.1 two-component hybrid histidine kinase [Fimbriimonas ginsengisoli Gsoil 348]
MDDSLRLSESIGERTVEDYRFLAEASALLGESLDYQATLQVVTQLAIPHLADWCAVDVLDENGQLESVALAHSDPEMVAWSRSYWMAHPHDMRADHGMPNVVRTGVPELYGDLIEELVRPRGVPDDVIRDIERAGFRSVVLVPLHARGKILGGMSFVSAEPNRYNWGDVEFFGFLARRAGAAVDNARLYTLARNEIAARVETEAELRAGEERFRAMANGAPVLIWTAGLDRRQSWFNRAWLEFTGRTMEQEIADSASSIHPGDVIQYRSAFENAFDERVPFQMQYRRRRKDGRWRWMLAHGSPLFDPEGEFVGYIGTCVDVTDQVASQAALERRVEQRTTELVSAYRQLESFSYSVAHDLRAPLRGINFGVGALLEDYGGLLDEGGRKELFRVRDAASRMDRLIQDLLEHARIGTKPLEKVNVDITAHARNVARDLEGGSYAPGDVTIEIQEGLTAEADQSLMRVILQNLIENALKFTKGQPHPRIEVGFKDGVFHVRDNGVGFESTLAQKLFEPFERGHDTSKFPGTGLGLANVKRVIERHGGHVWAESAPNKGASFYFTL